MKNRWFLLLVIFLIAGGTIFSQNPTDALRLTYPGIGSSARALGMGNAYSAISNDYSGSMFNPAGLGLIKNSDFVGGISNDGYKNDVTFFNNTTDYSNNATDLSQIGFAFAVPTTQGSLVFSFGFYKAKSFNSAMKFDGYNGGNNSFIRYMTESGDDVPYLLFLSNEVNGGGYETIISGGLNQRGDVIESGRINKWSFSGAVQVARELYIGGTLNVISGYYESNRNYYEEDTRNIYDASILTAPEEPRTADFQTFYLNDILEWDISGWDAKLGLLFVSPQNLRAGITVKFPTFYTVDEDYYVDAYSQFAKFQVYYLDEPILNELEYDITTPFEFTGALAYTYEGFTLSGEATYIDYTQTEFGDGLNEALANANNRDIKDLFTSVVNYNIGAEYVLPYPVITLRAGFMMQPSAYKDDPSDYDRKYITAGVGITPPNSNYSIDIGYAHGTWKNIGDNYGSGVSRTYQDVGRANLILALHYSMN